MSLKIMLPMAERAKREYAVTSLEQQDLARKFGLTVDQVRLELANLKKLMTDGAIVPVVTANRTKKIIKAHFESSNAIERQGA